MNLAILVEVFALLLLKSLSLDDASPGPISNITVMGTVFCDACSDNCFTKHSYFLKDVAVRVDCMFRVNSTSKEEISITVDRTTDRFGVYKLDIPPVDGFECKEGRQIDSFCRASLIGSPPTICSSPGLTTSTEHVSFKCNEDSVCLYNLNALYYRPGKKDLNLCGTTNREKMSSSNSNLNTSLFFWPPFPPFGFPWPHWPPMPFPFPSPPSLPFPFPPLPFLTPPPPSFPFPFPPLPFFTPPPPSFPFPFPPLPPIQSFFPSPPPPPPSFPFPPLPPLPSWFTPPPPPPSPPPPSFPFPFPPIPPITPIPSWFASPPPPPPSPPPPSLPFPFPPFPFPPFPPLTRIPPKPSPPPSTFSLRDPRSWLPSHLPSSSKQP